MVFIYTTCRDIAEAKNLGERIVKSRVAACVNIWPTETIYYNDHELHHESEAALLIKTNEPKVAEIESFSIKNHSYSTPFIGMVDVRRLNREYREWMTHVIR